MEQFLSLKRRERQIQKFLGQSTQLQNTQKYWQVQADFFLNKALNKLTT